MFQAGLTETQQAAVDDDGGHLLIVAGAGTGKTTTVAARVARLVAAGTPPERVLLLTFTRRAAAELLRRAGQQCGVDVAGRAWGGTFHAVANRLLRLHGRAIGLDPSFTVLDQADTADLLALCRAELDAHEGTQPAQRRRARKETLAAILSRIVNTATPLSEVLPRHFPWVDDDRDELKATFTAYGARKRSSQVVDYDDLLLLWQAVLNVPAVAAAVRQRFDHVLVDEYQDTNALQADLLALLCPPDGSGPTLTVVGDDAQAIYGFRAATVRNILEFPDRFGATTVTLEDNHRSTPEILATANAVLAGAPAGTSFPKALRTTRPAGPRPQVVECADEAHQSAEVCRRLLEAHERGIPLREQAVLFRTGHHSALLELELTARNIPFVKYGGLRFLEAAHVKDLVALCRVVENPRDELAWFRALVLVDGIGPTRARRLAATGECPDADLAAALHDARTVGAPGPAVERLRQWLDPVVARRYPSPGPRLADLDTIARAAASAASLERFLVELTLDPPSSTGDLAGAPSLDDDVLTLSTIHSAKGGEWRRVHVISVVDGNLPSDLATGDAEQVEEERRLLYVAVTRAQDELHLYSPLRMHHHRRTGGPRRDAHGWAPRCRFLDAGVMATLDTVGEVFDPPLATVPDLVAALLE